jgi:cardiolipin synthase
MVSNELVVALTAARRRMAGDGWRELATTVASLEGYPTSDTIRKATANILNRDAAWILAEAFTKSAQANWSEINVAITVVDTLVGDISPTTELIWTGPANNRFPVRRIDQVLYDLVSIARKRIILVTFAAHRVARLCEHLTSAVKRGVELSLIVESEQESEGQLTLDAVTAFQNVPREHTQIYYWPIAKRERNQAGRPGKLHIKCAVIDNVALISSANLTDDAFNRNMELGMLVRDETAVIAIAEHFQELIHAGVLVQVPQPN